MGANDSKGKGGERQFNGLMGVYVKTLKSDGIQGLYRGFTISAVGIFIYRGMYFGMFDTLKPMLIGGKDSSVAASFLLGWAVTVTAGLMSYPIDTIRRRMMMTSGGGVKYKGSIDCGMQVMKNEGFMSLMKGAGANILRGVCRRWCARRFRQVPGHVHRMENQPVSGFVRWVHASDIKQRTSREGKRRRCQWRPSLRSSHAETL